jgi:hypothetical protein
MPDLDGFIKLNDAQIRSNESQAGIVDRLSGIPQKLAQAALVEQQAVHQHLENIAKELDIEWDAQAEASLLRTRNARLRALRLAQDEAVLLKSHVLHVGFLLRGSGTVAGISAGWQGFYYLFAHAPVKAIEAAFTAAAGVSAAELKYWEHPTVPVMVAPGAPDNGTLLDWARRHNYYPRVGTPAYQMVAGILQSLSDAAGQRAAQLDARLDVLKKDVDAILARDWDRLKQQGV